MSETETPAETDLLKQCPWCDYNLTGLPAEHICPECGNTVDRTAIRLGDTRHRMERDVRITLLLLGAALIVSPLDVPPDPLTWLWRASLILTPVLVVILINPRLRIILLPLGAALILSLLDAPPDPLIWLWRASLILTPFLIVILISSPRLRSILLMRDQILIERPYRQPIAIPWKRVVAASPGFGHYTLKIHLRNPSRIFRIGFKTRQRKAGLPQHGIQLINAMVAMDKNEQ